MFSVQHVFYYNYLYLRQPVEEIDSWHKIGLQSIYYGGGERSVSEIVWWNNETADGIASTLKDTEEGAAVYNLSGQRVGRNFKGIIIKDGRKMLT